MQYQWILDTRTSDIESPSTANSLTEFMREDVNNIRCRMVQTDPAIEACNQKRNGSLFSASGSSFALQCLEVDLVPTALTPCD